MYSQWERRVMICEQRPSIFEQLLLTVTYSIVPTKNAKTLDNDLAVILQRLSNVGDVHWKYGSRGGLEQNLAACSSHAGDRNPSVSRSLHHLSKKINFMMKHI